MERVARRRLVFDPRLQQIGRRAVTAEGRRGLGPTPCSGEKAPAPQTFGRSVARSLPPFHAVVWDLGAASLRARRAQVPPSARHAPHRDVYKPFTVFRRFSLPVLSAQAAAAAAAATREVWPWSMLHLARTALALPASSGSSSVSLVISRFLSLSFSLSSLGSFLSPARHLPLSYLVHTIVLPLALPF